MAGYKTWFPIRNKRRISLGCFLFLFLLLFKPEMLPEKSLCFKQNHLCLCLNTNIDTGPSLGMTVFFSLAANQNQTLWVCSCWYLTPYSEACLLNWGYTQGRPQQRNTCWKTFPLRSKRLPPLTYSVNRLLSVKLITVPSEEIWRAGWAVSLNRRNRVPVAVKKNKIITLLQQ